VAAARAKPQNIDQYIAACPPQVRPILRKLRSTIKRAAPPKTAELISYRMPAFALHGILVYFAAFKNHIGMFPPLKGDAKLQAAALKYAGPKGNLKFPLDQPIPYALIARIVKSRAKRNLAESSKQLKSSARASACPALHQVAQR
jgi:uncharacterized protein YdhG (YjbR/CyaY superfamily)